MADLSITVANVVKGTSARTETGIAGATVTAGQMVYLDTADNKYKLADNDSATALVRTVRGMALHGSLAGQPLTVLLSGQVSLGAILTVGTVYCLSSTAGGICPAADIASGDYLTVIGVPLSTSILDVMVKESGVVT